MNPARPLVNSVTAIPLFPICRTESISGDRGRLYSSNLSYISGKFTVIDTVIPSNGTNSVPRRTWGIFSSAIDERATANDGGNEGTKFRPDLNSLSIENIDERDIVPFGLCHTEGSLNNQLRKAKSTLPTLFLLKVRPIEPLGFKRSLS